MDDIKQGDEAAEEDRGLAREPGCDVPQERHVGDDPVGLGDVVLLGIGDAVGVALESQRDAAVDAGSDVDHAVADPGARVVVDAD